MKKLALASLLVAVLILSMAAPALAWDRAEGCTTDGYGVPWAWGATVTCRQTFQPYIIVGQGQLDANGCFSVFIGNGHEVACTIDYNPGPLGDPADDICIVPTDTSYQPLPWPCGPIDTGTGPNAVTLSSFAGAVSLPASTVVLALSAVLGGAAVWKRRK